jgi:hypothetical protein
MGSVHQPQTPATNYTFDLKEGGGSRHSLVQNYAKSLKYYAQNKHKIISLIFYHRLNSYQSAL